MKASLLAALLATCTCCLAQSLGKLNNVVLNSDGDKFSYTGEIKTGKANGKGFAVSVDNQIKYLGDFENGLFNGQGVLQYNDGRLWVGGFKDGTPYDQNVIVDANNNFYYGKIGKHGFDGRTIVLFNDNRIEVGSYTTPKLNGRMLYINSSGEAISDLDYIEGVCTGHGYDYNVTTEKFLAGEFRDNHKVGDNLGGFRSFMGDSRFKGRVLGDRILMYTSADAKGEIYDTAFSYNKATGERYFGRFNHSRFRSGVYLIGDTVRYVGDSDEEGRREGLCAFYKKGVVLLYGNSNADTMNGKCTYLNLKYSEFYQGNFYGFLTGNGIMVNGDKRLYMGTFSEGLLNGQGVMVDKDGIVKKGIFKDGELISATKSNVAPPANLNMHPKDVCTAINFLLKNYEDEFRSLSDGKQFAAKAGVVDPFVNSDNDALGSYYYFPGGVTNKILPVSAGSLRHQTVFKAGLIVSKDFTVIKKRYDDLCRQLQVCSITSLNGRPLRLFGKVQVLVPHADHDQASIFTLPSYKGKAGTVRIVVVVTAYEGGYQLEMIINNKADEAW